jgi:Protein of unknown function (DUF3168)
MNASWALQQAVFATLVMSGAVRDVAGDRVFDAVPRGAGFPYIVVGEAAESNDGTATEQGSEHQLAIHVWSRACGHRECKEAAETVREVLDGETCRAIVRFRAVTEPA